MDVNYLISLIFSVLYVWKVRKFAPLFIMAIFIFTYCINSFPLFYANIFSGARFKYQTISFYSEVYFSFLCFIIPLYFITPKIKKRFYLSSYIPQFESNTIYYICVLVLTFFLAFGISGDTIMSSGGYGKGEIVSLGGFSEYYIVFTILGIIYSGKSLTKQLIIAVISTIIVIKFVLFGGRIALIQLLLLYFILFFDTPKFHFRISVILVFILLGFYLLQIMACLRSNFLFYYKNGLATLLIAPFDNDYMKVLSSTFGNQNDIIYASSVFTQYADYIGVTGRLKLFFYNVLALFLPYSLLPQDANIALNVQKSFASTGGGALISSYYYLFIGNIGVFFLGGFIGSILRNFIKNKGQTIVLYAIFLLILYPRWFGYNHVALFKIPIFCYLFINFVRYLIKSLNIDKTSKLS